MIIIYVVSMQCYGLGVNFTELGRVMEMNSLLVYNASLTLCLCTTKNMGIAGAQNGIK